MERVYFEYGVCVICWGKLCNFNLYKYKKAGLVKRSDEKGEAIYANFWPVFSYFSNEASPILMEEAQNGVGH